MAFSIVRETPFNGYTNQLPLNTEDRSGNAFWTQRSIQNDFFCLSSNQIEVISWRLLGTAALIGATTLVGLAAFEIVALPVALYAIPTVILASYSIWQSTRIDDYENEAQLAQMRVEAQRLTLDQVAARFEWNEIFENRILTPSQFVNLYRRQVLEMGVIDLVKYYEKVKRHTDPFNEGPLHYYPVPHPREHAAKWQIETANKTFKQIISEYPLDKLERLGIIDYSEMLKIRELLGIYRLAETAYQAQEQLADQEFQQATTAYSQILNQELAAINGIYQANGAVRANQGFEDREMIARLAIENEASNRLRHARDLHQQRIAALFPHRHIQARQNLNPQQRIVYDESVQTLHRAEQEIARDLHQRLEQHHAFFSRQRDELNAEIERVNQVCNQMRERAQERFTQRAGPANQAKEVRLRPHQEQLERIAVDLDRTYRAYLRQLRALR